MTDLPHTPTTGQVETGFALYLYDRENIVIGAGRDRFKAWFVAEIAAAEQRGAIKALRDAADIKLGNGYYEMLVEDELNTRADLLEGDDD